MKKLLLILCLGILIISCGNKKNKKISSTKHKIDKKTEKTNDETPKKQEIPKDFEPKIIKNQETGEYIIQVYVPETATHDEIYKTIMDIQLKKRKDFLNDNILIVAYSDEDFISKHLMGTHARWKIEKGVTKYMKIFPKAEQLTSENKKDFLEYLKIIEALLSTGDDLKKAKKDAEPLIKARHPKNYKNIIQKAEKYLYGTENEKTEKELMDNTKKINRKIH